MKIYTIVTDKNGNMSKYLINAMSLQHGSDKAFKYHVFNGGWPKCIQAINEAALKSRNEYTTNQFKQVTIK